MNLDDLRAELPLVDKLAYFQTGSVGPVPDSVIQHIYETLRFVNHNGLAVPETRLALQQQETEAKQKLARFLRASPDELAWMPNTSQAMHKVLHAMRWLPGDEFIVTSAEHVSIQGACQALIRDYGVVVKTIPATEGEVVLLGALEAAITKRTKLFCISDVSTMDGRRLPVRPSIAIAHAHNVPVLVDVAQSVGQCGVDLTALGGDFAIGSLHKWMLGSTGLGFLYVNRARLASFIPDFIPDYHPWTKMDGPLPPIDAASRSDQGTHDFAARISVSQTVDILKAIGIAQIEAHCRQLSLLFCDEVATWPKVHMVSSTDPHKMTGLCCIGFAGYGEQDVRALVARLLEERIVAKYQPEPNGLRLSFAPFNTTSEVERLLTVLKRLLGM